jgi:hypothetical protein
MWRSRLPLVAALAPGARGDSTPDDAVLSIPSAIDQVVPILAGGDK